MLGHKCHEFWADPEKPCDGCPTVKAFKTGKSEHTEIVSPDGRVWDEGGEPVFDPSGRLIGVVEIAHDITDRKRAEAALRDSEGMRKNILSASPVGTTYFEEGRLKWTNQAMVEMFGYERQEEYLGKKAREFYASSEEYHRVQEMFFKELAAGKSVETETKFTRKDGSVFDGHIRISAVDPANPRKGTISSISDITERKRAEEALGESEERLRQIAEATEDVFWMADWDTRRVMYVNQAYETIWGRSPQKILDDPAEWANGLHPDDRERAVEKFLNMKEDDIYDNTYRVVRPDGTVRWVRDRGFPVFNKQGKVYRIVGTVQDITERKKAEEVRLRLLTAIEQAAETIVITDPEGTIRYVNPAFESVTGYTRGEAVGQNPRILKSGQHDEEFYKKMWATLAGGGAWTGHFVNKKKDGTLYEEDATISPVKDESGKIINYVAVKRNVTGEILLEKQLRQAQKMEAIGTLAGGIAHDFNNLLTIILGYSELALLEKSKGEPGYEELQTILKTTKRGADLVRQILTFSREVETKPRPISLNHEVQHAQELLYKTIPKMIEIELLLADDLKTTNVDPVQMEQVLINLAVNAKDAMPDGGRLVFETRNVSLDEEYCKTHLEAEPGEYVMLMVSDTGHGIEKKALERIFEPFYTTKKPGEGTGLGLSMVHGIVKQNHGFIMCYSEPGEGTTFKIYLPVIDLDMEPDAASTEEMPAFGTETILLVDDEESIRDLGERILTQAGYTVLTAGNGQEALEVYQEQQADISLVILDLIMPEMGGRQCLEELLKIDSDAKVLIASGLSVNGPTREAIKGQTRGFVGKPFDMSQLLQTVRKVLDED